MQHTFLLDTSGRFTAGAGLPLSDRGFRYGMSVFETVAIRDARPLLLEEHLAGLSTSATAAGFHTPDGWQTSARSLLATPPIREGVVRIYLTAGDAGAALSRVAILFEEMSVPAGMTRMSAVTVDFTPATPFGKTGNYWPHLLARPREGVEAILCRSDGTVLGGAMSNLFVVLEGRLLTPRQPVRRGVVRAWIGAEEADVTREDLSRVTSAFVTNSRIGLCTLTSIDERALTPPPVVESLWARYRAEVLRAD